MRSHPIFKARSFLPRIAVVAALAITAVGSVKAQYGISPSQTGMFFDDLRGRANAKNQAGHVQQGEGVYDFSQQGGYQGNTTDSGETVLDDASRQIAQGYNGVGNIVYSQRQAGDYTQYSGPYPVSSTFFAPPYTSDPFLAGRRNMKIGPVNLGFGLSTLVEYNDNITRSGTDKVSDVIAGAYLNIDANYQVTQKSTLSLATSIGFDHYFDHPELSAYGKDKEFVVNVLPGSTLSLDGKIGPVYVVVYDRMSVRPATQNDFALNDRNIFGVFQNDAGLGASWAINSKTTLSVNYLHSSDNALDNGNANGINTNRYDRTIDSLQGSLSWSPNGVILTGIEGGTSWVSYDQSFNNDGQMSNAGMFISAPLGKSTSIRVSGGVQDFAFDAPSSTSNTATGTGIEPAVTGDTSDLSSYYYNVTLSNRLSSRVSHALSFGHESSLNTVSNFITADYVSYGVGIIAWSGSRLSLSSYYENAKDSGGALKEGIEQWGVDAYLSHQLTPRLRMGLGYHYGISNSDKANADGSGRDYTQQAFNADVTYAFTQKMFVTLAYRFLTTDADTDVYSFDQNRVILSANYNF